MIYAYLILIGALPVVLFVMSRDVDDVVAQLPGGVRNPAWE